MTKIYKLPEAAKLLGISYSGAKNRIDSGLMHAEQVAGFLWTVTQDEIDRQLSLHGHGRMKKKKQ